MDFFVFLALKKNWCIFCKGRWGKKELFIPDQISWSVWKNFHLYSLIATMQLEKMWFEYIWNLSNLLLLMYLYFLKIYILNIILILKEDGSLNHGFIKSVLTFTFWNPLEVFYQSHRDNEVWLFMFRYQLKGNH